VKYWKIYWDGGLGTLSYAPTDTVVYPLMSYTKNIGI
jgi:hypothetical protein